MAEKFHVEIVDDPDSPVLLCCPHGSQTLSIGEARRLIKDLWRAIRAAEKDGSRPRRYRCRLCGEVFDTRTGKGRMHMANVHGRSLKYAVEAGLVEKLEE